MHKRLIIILMFGLVCFGCNEEKKPEDNQKQEVQKNEGDFFVEVEQLPLPIGGIKSLASKIVYPKEAKQNGVQGTVFVKAYIDEKGNVLKTEIIKSVGYGCDEAATEAIMKTKFEPGKNNGVPVKVKVSIPIKFKLE